jgi:ribonuclease HII
VLNFEFDKQFNSNLIGVDEVGRGPVAGPVVAGAVHISREDIESAIFILGVQDSKKISRAQRLDLSGKILSKYECGIGIATIEEIEKYNILEATKIACKRAVEKIINSDKHMIVIDGNMKFDFANYRSIIKGDQKSYAIAAASIIAKVYRDSLMSTLSEEHPYYGWAQNSGYGTKKHIDAIKQYGITTYHRKSFLKKI